MKELERDLIEIELEIKDARIAKEGISDKILCTERGILLWEKKIKLEKETQTALNSSKHAIEIQGMEKEIHRMKHRLEVLKRHEEKMVRDMEFAIHKREDIAVKFQNVKYGESNKSRHTSITEARQRKILLAREQGESDKEKLMAATNLAKAEVKYKKGMDGILATKQEVENGMHLHRSLQNMVNQMTFEKQRLMVRFGMS
eukprot:CAMPEP_0197239666 /NCGR_PEP_ID=MMETSP1429-20130617/6115_1 /TAXON_ID=49237 /ORGANISM="Chaetoceros  sp., Strain UNC1202" /LENGTH=200 /DNA_ID=CAMNT_0042699129 /DNA_START=3 /DNA_END=608 /DNA_ORIENTATION=+